MALRIHWLAGAGLAAALSGCAAVEGLVPARPNVAAPAATPASTSYETLPATGLIGAWGMASFREEKDRARTERMARAQCRNPYRISKGPTDGVIMHVADDATPYELAMKRGRDGKTYLGFGVPPPDAQDREILSMTEREIVMRFVDPDANNRYGTFIYVRC